MKSLGHAIHMRQALTANGHLIDLKLYNLYSFTAICDIFSLRSLRLCSNMFGCIFEAIYRKDSTLPRLQTIHFGAGSYQLVGTLHLPDAPNPPVVIGCHGLLANRHSQKQISLAAACNQIGIAYFRFDHRGCGDSQGDFKTVTTLSARRQDLYHAIQTMQHYSGTGPLRALFGSSFGGTVILAYAAEHPSPALITYAAPINSADIHHSNIRDNNGALPPSALLTKNLEFDVTLKLSAISNILICHSQNDETVPVNHALRIHQSADHPKKIHIFSNGDHRMSNSTHQKQFEDLFIQWLKTTKKTAVLRPSFNQ